jgi:hypothetical protein
MIAQSPGRVDHLMHKHPSIDPRRQVQWDGSRKIATICASAKRDFRISTFFSEDLFSKVFWSEIWGAGQSFICSGFKPAAARSAIASKARSISAAY